MINKQKSRITPENRDFFTPEYLRQEKHYVLEEIRQLERENKPLRLQCQNLLAEKEKALPSPGYESQSGASHIFYNKNFKKQETPETFGKELAKERRRFSECNKLKLQYELQVANQERKRVLEEIRAVQKEIENKKSRLNMKTNSALANTIKDQDAMIDALQETFRELKEKEQLLKNAALGCMRKSMVSVEDEREVELLKKKLEQLNTIRLRKNREYRKRKNELKKKRNSLVEQIEAKKRKKQEIEKRENWKKTLNIREKVVSEEDYQPKTVVTTAYQQNKLPPLISETIQSLGRNCFNEEEEYEYDSSYSQGNSL